MKFAIGARFRAIRDKLALSQREFAQVLDLSQSGYSAVEKGEHAPSIQVASTIAERYPDISLRWLLTGEGEMTSSADPAVPSQSSPLVVEDELVKELAELQLMASRSSQAMARAIVLALRSAAEPVSRRDLAQACGATPEAMAIDVALLKRVGLVREDAKGLTAQGYALTSVTAADAAEIALEVIDVMLRRVLPAADRNDGSARIIVAEGAVGDARRAVDELAAYIRERLESDDGPERVTVVLGITNSRR